MRVIRVALVGFVALLLTPLAAAAQGAASEPRQNSQFDFYVLSLSWSPSFCAAAAERNPAQGGGAECTGKPTGKSYGFIVHGLWPQFETGFPEYCENPAPRLDRGLVAVMLDLMPAPRLIFNEWDRHGTCSGLSPRAYFDTVRRARAAVKIPADYAEPRAALTVTPGAVAAAFIAANPGLSNAAIAIACDDKRLTGVRICLNKDLSAGAQFHDCAEVAKRGCRREQLVMPGAAGPHGGNS